MAEHTYDSIVRRLESLSDPEAVKGMARFGITPKHTHGVPMPALKELAKEIGKDHKLALRLWKKNNRETRILASLIDEPGKVTEAQMEEWAKEFDYWEICDQVCINLFKYVPFARAKAVEWSSREEEYVKRTGFVLITRFAVSDKETEDSTFEQYFRLIKRESTDERPMVRKAVNWALRQIGKRNPALNRKAISLAKEIRKMDSKAAKWIASDALRELTSPAVQKRLKSKQASKPPPPFY